MVTIPLTASQMDTVFQHQSLLYKQVTTLSPARRGRPIWLFPKWWSFLNISPKPKANQNFLFSFLPIPFAFFSIPMEKTNLEALLKWSMKHIRVGSKWWETSFRASALHTWLPCWSLLWGQKDQSHRNSLKSESAIGTQPVDNHRNLLPPGWKSSYWNRLGNVSNSTHSSLNKALPNFIQLIPAPEQGDPWLALGTPLPRASAPRSVLNLTCRRDRRGLPLSLS